MQNFSVHLQLLVAGGIVAVAITALLFFRRRRMPRATLVFFLVGVCCLFVASARPIWRSKAAGRVAVMVDLSPSTRGAAYRDPAILRRRLGELLGATRYQLVFFANGNESGSLASDAPLADIQAERTTFIPPPADAVLLFSDGRFDSRDPLPPIYPILDTGLENLNDAAITGMDVNGDQLTVTVTNNGLPRILTIHGVVDSPTETVEGNQTIIRRITPYANRVWAELNPGDAWPENDAMSLRISPATNSERWWIGDSAPAGWRKIERLPAESGDYLAPAVILLNNIPATDLPFASQQRLQQYARDLGGAVVILGGDHAFGVGGYDGTILGSLSPLGSSPPMPATGWILLIDASGSMATPQADGASRWDLASGAMMHLLPFLPPEDFVRLGQFSDSLRWWMEAIPAKEAANRPLPPSDAQPHGATNLQPVLEALAAKPSGLSTQLILITDADVAITEAAALAVKLKSAGIRLHLLAIDQGKGLGQLREIVAATGGSVVTEANPSRWAASIRQLLTAATPDRYSLTPISVHFLGPAATFAGGDITGWNRTWILPRATLLAEGDDHQPMAALWDYGAGRVISATFPAISRAGRLADLVAQAPRDPRVKVSWNNGPILHVSVDATDQQNYLNDLQLTLDIWNEGVPSPMRQAIPQTAPGRYELKIPAPRHSSIATVRQGERVIDRRSIPGWYPEEFIAIGEDAIALTSLAGRTGGKVIPPNRKMPLQLHFAREAHALTPWLAMCGAMFLAGGLVIWRRR